MDAVKILSVLLLIGMIGFMLPRALAAVKSAPKGSSEDWKGFLLPIVGVILFIVLLTKMV